MRANLVILFISREETLYRLSKKILSSICPSRNIHKKSEEIYIEKPHTCFFYTKEHMDGLKKYAFTSMTYLYRNMNGKIVSYN